MKPQSTAILLVEDNPGDARLLQEALREKGTYPYLLERAGRLEEGLERLSRGGLDLVLLDLFLPDSGGLATLKRVQEAAPQVPVVVLTGFNDREAAVRSLQEGAQDFLLKDEMNGDLLDRSVRYAIERFRLLSKLREREERYYLVAQGSHDGLWDWDLRTDRVYFSPRWKAMLGYSIAEVGEAPAEWFDRVHPDDLARVRKHLDRHLSGKTPHFDSEHRLRHRDGRYRWVLGRGLADWREGKTPVRVAGSFTDITHHKEMERQLALRAYYDPLTGLPNRAFFIDGLERGLARLRKHSGRLMALFFIDLDSLKSVNDKLGHHAGDALLMEFARRLRSCVRPRDLAARLGGDEFTVLLEDLEDHSEALHAADRILETMREPLQLGAEVVSTTASIGIAYSDGAENSIDGMLRAADSAMYRAKVAGKARYEVHEMPRPQGRERRLHGA